MAFIHLFLHWHSLMKSKAFSWVGLKERRTLESPFECLPILKFLENSPWPPLMFTMEVGITAQRLHATDKALESSKLLKGLLVDLPESLAQAFHLVRIVVLSHSGSCNRKPYSPFPIQMGLAFSFYWNLIFIFHLFSNRCTAWTWISAHMTDLTLEKLIYYPINVVKVALLPCFHLRYNVFLDLVNYCKRTDFGDCF